MYTASRARVLRTALFLMASLVWAPAHAELSPEDLAKIAQNPVGNLISVPFQENAYFNVGPLDGTQNVLNIQPVIPIDINENWNIITRTILPIISLPAFAPGQGGTSGIGDVQISAFLSPANPGGLIWGVGAVAQLPTHSNDALGNNNAGLGPTVVVAHLTQGDPWVYGVLLMPLGHPFTAHHRAMVSALSQRRADDEHQTKTSDSRAPATGALWSRRRDFSRIFHGIGLVYR
jgi:hypothetical protein